MSFNDFIQFGQHARDLSLVKVELALQTIPVSGVSRDAVCLEVTASVTAADFDVQLVLDRTELALIGREGEKVRKSVAKIGEISPEETRVVRTPKSASRDLNVCRDPIRVVVNMLSTLLVAVGV